MEAVRHNWQWRAPGSAGSGAADATAGTVARAGGGLARGAGVAHNLLYEVAGVHCQRGQAGWSRVGGVCWRGVFFRRLPQFRGLGATDDLLRRCRQV